MEGNLKFFTNEPERDLYSKFQTLLRGEINFFDVIVGYFRTSGFFRMCNALTEVEKIRILVGLNVDKRTVQLLEMNKSQNLFSPTLKIAKETFSKTVKSEFDESEVTREIEYGVRKFLEWLKSGKLEIRLYTQAPLHAKVYVMRKCEKEITAEIDSVITGSSKERPYKVDKKFTKVIAAVLSTNLFWFYQQTYTNGLDLKQFEIETFPLFELEKLPAETLDAVGKLYDEYLTDIEKNVTVRTSSAGSSYNVATFKNYKISKSKNLIDKLDDVIGKFYGLTDEEINFVKNFELEIRIGTDETD